MELIDRFFKPPPASFFLFGPRGTGKSTFISKVFKDSLSVDMLDPERVRYFSAMPERLREITDAYAKPGTLVIDEIQKVPDLLPVVHSVMEQKKGWNFILTGSSVRKLKRSGLDLLGGRAILCTMHPFFQ
jgi:predicted AAA+ superfamily ATPase